MDSADPARTLELQLQLRRLEIEEAKRQRRFQAKREDKQRQWEAQERAKDRENEARRWENEERQRQFELCRFCLLYTSPSPRDGLLSRMPSSA